MIEVEIEKKVIAYIVLAIFILLVFVLGWRATPYSHGRPVLLTRGARSVKLYVEAASGWLVEVSVQREKLNGVLPGDVASLPTPIPPGGRPESIYQASKTVADAERRLLVALSQAERWEVPAGFSGLHSIIVGAIKGHIELAEMIGDYIGAPEPEKLRGIEEQLTSSGEALERAQETLEKQRKETFR